MRISDWSSDVCSSDLPRTVGQHVARRLARPDERRKPGAAGNVLRRHSGAFADVLARAGADRIRRPHLDPVAVAAGAAPGAGHARRADLELRDGPRAHRGPPDGRARPFAHRAGRYTPQPRPPPAPPPPPPRAAPLSLTVP